MQESLPSSSHADRALTGDDLGAQPLAAAGRAPNLLPTFLLLGALLWIFTMTGGRQVFVAEVLGKAYDSQAEHFLRGDVGVDSEAIAHEAMIVKGKTRMYFGPFPAFLRIPLNFVYPEGRGKWSRISGFGAGMIALGAFAGLIRMALRSSQLPRRWKACLGNASLVGFALGSPLLLLLGNLSIYDEAIIWGLAWSLAALYFALRAGEAQDAAALTWSLAAFSFCAGAALLSRATFGAPFLLIAPVLAFRLIRKNLIRNGAALFLPLGAAFVFYLFLTYARFGALEGMPMRYSTNTEQREFAMKHGLFRPERIPYSFADYFVLRVPRPQREPPYLEGSRQPCDANLYVMPFTETYSSLLWCSSWIVLGAIVGMAQLLRPGGFDWANRAIAAALFLECLIILSFMGLAQRYVAEFFPFLGFCFVVFLRRANAAFRLRHLILVLVAASVVINSLSTVSWLLEADLNVPAATKAKWNELLGRKVRQ